jgi:hypothetical protein
MLSSLEARHTEVLLIQAAVRGWVDDPYYVTLWRQGPYDNLNIKNDG